MTMRKTQTTAITHETTEQCDNPLVFELSNGKESYGVSVEAILVCLNLAETKGAVPKLEDDWWLSIKRMYPEVERTLSGCI